MLENEPSWGEVRKQSLLRKTLYALGLAVCALVAVPALTPMAVPPAEAAFAPSGSGLYKGTIDWMEWGTTTGSVVANNQIASSTRIIAGQVLTTSCTINNISGTGGIRTYRSGMYDGDALDDLYYKGNPGNTNQLIYGLANSTNGGTVSFKVSCNASLGGVPVSLGGLVVADAESSNKSQGEYISAKPDQQNATWRIIERSRSENCPTSVLADLAADKTLKLYPNGEQCRSLQTATGNGPMAIGYMDGASSATLSMKGGGVSAIALGAVLESDFGDAPVTYGAAGALFQPTWAGGALPVATGTNVSNSTFGLGIPGQPVPRLGATTDSDVGYQPNADASGDDKAGVVRDGVVVNDEDAIPLQSTPLRVVPGEPYILNNVACTGPGYVAGWVDWNLNGTFDAGEKSAVAACTGSFVNLSWAVPTDVKNTPGQTKSFLRLRIASDVAGVASPMGMSTSGEVEDHAIRISTSNLSLQKNITARVAPTDQFTLSITPAGGATTSESTSGSATGLQEKMIGPVTTTKNKTYTLKEVATGGPLTPLSEYDTAIQCAGTYSDGTSAPPTATIPVVQGEATITMPEPSPTLGAQSIVCTFTNTPKAATLSVNKSWVVNGTNYTNGAQPAGISAQLKFAGQNQAWSTPKAGYAAGNKVVVSETTSFAETMPGCTLDKARVTSVNGAPVDAVLPYDQTLRAGANTAQVINTVTCNTSLTLAKKVVGGNAQPSNWTLSAYPGSGPAVVQGASGSAPVTNANVATGVPLQLGESGGSALYVQDDSRTKGEQELAPRSTGSWACTAAVSGQNSPVSGRMGTDGTITPTLGSKITCEATNRTAELTILKRVENVNGTGTGNPEDWNLTAAPKNGVDGLPAPNVVKGSATKIPASTFNVRPGQEYKLSESGVLGGYLQVGLQRFTGSDSTDAGQIAQDTNWTSVDVAAPVSIAAGKSAVYRFVNRDAVRFTLPLTGGGGTSTFLVGGGIAASLALGTAIVFAYRRRTSNNHS